MRDVGLQKPIRSQFQRAYIGKQITLATDTVTMFIVKSNRIILRELLQSIAYRPPPHPPNKRIQRMSPHRLNSQYLAEPLSLPFFLFSLKPLSTPFLFNLHSKIVHLFEDHISLISYFPVSRSPFL